IRSAKNAAKNARGIYIEYLLRQAEKFGASPPPPHHLQKIRLLNHLRMVLGDLLFPLRRILMEHLGMVFHLNPRKESPFIPHITRPTCLLRPLPEEKIPEVRGRVGRVGRVVKVKSSLSLPKTSSLLSV